MAKASFGTKRDGREKLGLVLDHMKVGHMKVGSQHNATQCNTCNTCMQGTSHDTVFSAFVRMAISSVSAMRIFVAVNVVKFPGVKPDDRYVMQHERGSASLGTMRLHHHVLV